MDESMLPPNSRERLLQQIREMATPYDLDALVRDGVLARAGGAWYRVVDANRLPSVVLKHADAARTESDGRASLRIPADSMKRAAELYRDVFGEDPPTAQVSRLK